MSCNIAMAPLLKGEENLNGFADTASKVMSYRDALHWTMHDALRCNASVVLMGQGVDDHKGIFGSTIGLAQEFGADRVMDTPLAEEGMTGVAIGAALNGLYPIQTHIRADFSLLAVGEMLSPTPHFYQGANDTPGFRWSRTALRGHCAQT